MVASAPESAADWVAVGSWRRLGLGRYLLGVAGLAGLYYGSAKLGYALSFAGPVAAVIWLPVGVGVAFLAIFGLRYWPGALIGDLLANNYLALPVAGALGQTVGNLCEVVIAAWLIRRLMRAGEPLERTAGVGGLVLCLAAGTLVSATVGPLSLLAAGAVSSGSLLSVMRTWWLGDFCGALVVVPLALAWRRLPSVRLSRRRAGEAVLLLALILAVSAVAARAGEPFTYLVFPVLAWAVLRFGARGGTLALLVTVSVMIWMTTREHPFSADSFTRSVTSTQLFVAVAAVSVLLLAAVLSEKHVLADQLGASRARAVHAAESERRRVERDLHDGAQQRLLALAAHLSLAGDSASERELNLAIDELRELTHGMHPTVLRELGLAGAVRSLAARSAVPATLADLPSRRLDDAAEAAAYFVVTEAVANVQKHAGASSILIAVRYAFPSLALEITDDGRGGAVERPGSGLAGVRERVESLDGDFSVRSSTRGTTISATIPASPA